MSDTFERAVALHRAGRLAEAEALYADALAANPDLPDGRRLMAILRTQQGRHAEALALVVAAIEREPRAAKAHATHASILHALGRHAEALGAMDRAVALDPALAESHYNRAVMLQGLDRHPEALEGLDRALALKPDFLPALVTRGNVLQALGRSTDAIAAYDRALAQNPDFVEAHANRGTALESLQRHAEALAAYDRALALKPDSADVLFNRGIALQALERFAEALASYDRALALAPANAEIMLNRGNALRLLDRRAEALASYGEALASDPEHAPTRWLMTMAQLPAIPEDEAASARCRAAFARELERLDAWFDDARIERGFESVGAMPPFELAYWEENNRDLLARYGSLCARIMGRWLDRQDLRASSAPDRPIRVGVVSAHFHDHSVWNAIVKGWFGQLDREQFALYAYHLGPGDDEQTRLAQAGAARFERGPHDLRGWVEAILGDGLDVLIYPEIGMDRMTSRLASLRLAPVQAASWGHPETTGLPTIDYFLSAEDFEPPDAQANYVERLVALPHLGTYCERARVTPAAPDLGALGVDPDAPLLVCPGTPFKYAPAHDRVLTAIARALGRCQLLFFVHRNRAHTDRLRARLAAAFAREGLDPGRFLVFAPWQSRPAFYGLMRRARVFLDTIGFSGFNTALQAVECGLPIVTRAGRFMRGRFAGGLLARIGVPELVVRTEDDYVAAAVRLCRDDLHRAELARRIEAGRDVLFEDTAPIRALEAFLSGVAARPAGSPREA